MLKLKSSKVKLYSLAIPAITLAAIEMFGYRWEAQSPVKMEPIPEESEYNVNQSPNCSEGLPLATARSIYYYVGSSKEAMRSRFGMPVDPSDPWYDTYTIAGKCLMKVTVEYDANGKAINVY